MILKNNKAFTLVEIMIGIVIFSFVIIGAFQSISAVTIGKVKLIHKTNMQKDSFYFTEKLFEMIKTGGTIDYEEYFNRKVIGTVTSSGYYSIESGYGNFGSGVIVPSLAFGDDFYYCRSGDGIANNMGSGMVNPNGGCYSNNFNNYSADVLGKQQRYGQYSFQFIDYNSNYDGDLGDEDLDLKILGDDDDEYLGEGPSVFTGGTDVKELYLITGDKKERNYFRWKVIKDINAAGLCTMDNLTNTIIGTGCIGNIQHMRLIGKDWGMDHDLSSSDSTQYDGVVDTWIIDPDFTGGFEIVAGTGSIDNYWVNLFPDTINVSEFKVYPYPNKDINNAWKNNEPPVNIAPYVTLQITLEPSAMIKRKMKQDGSKFSFSTTINLTEVYSN